MEDETTYQEVPQVAQDVADGQSVVDAVHADNAALADDVVSRVNDMLLQAQSDGDVESTVALSDDQWSKVIEQMRYQNTFGIMSCICTMAVFGAVVAHMVVKGWRRG